MVEFQTVWGWQPALYLFLGGMGAGALVFAGILTLIDRKHHNTTICISQWIAAACMAVGLLLLLSELTNPVRGVMAWESFVNFTSWMTWGAWGVLVEIVSIVVRKRERMTERCSALLEKSVVTLVALEAVVLVAYLATVGGEGAAAEAATASVVAITTGSLAPWFWCLVVLCGLVAPLVASVLAMKARKGRDVSTIVVSGAIGALVGGCALRFIVVMAGAHADLVADTVMSLLL